MSETRSRAEIWRARGVRVLDLAPGVALALLLAGIAFLLQSRLGVPAVAGALLFGLLLAPFAQKSRLTSGVKFTAATLLRLGVALLGARIAVADLAALGGGPVFLILFTLATTLLLGSFIARRIGLSAPFSWISAGAVAICGASAALAISAVFPQDRKRELEAATVVAMITLIGSAGMMLYPLLAQLAGLDDRLTGVFLGASLHEVAQAVAAGFAVSEPAGNAGALSKLVRVAMLAPVIIALSMTIGARRAAVDLEDGEDARPAPPLIPWFLGLFLLFALLVNTGLAPGPAVAAASEASRWLLVMAIAALGLKISVAAVREAGAKPLLAVLIQTLICGATAFAGVVLLAYFAS